jgi:hypothetical protein
MMVDVITGDRFKLRMTPEIDLSKLTVAEKDALILSLLPLVGRLKAALARIGELKTQLAAFERPPKTPDNSARTHEAPGFDR